MGILEQDDLLGRRASGTQLTLNSSRVADSSFIPDSQVGSNEVWQVFSQQPGTVREAALFYFRAAIDTGWRIVAVDCGSGTVSIFGAKNHGEWNARLRVQVSMHEQQEARVDVLFSAPFHERSGGPPPPLVGIDSVDSTCLDEGSGA